MRSFVKFGLITGLLVSLWNISCFTIVGHLNSLLSLGIPAARIRAYSGLFSLIILGCGIYFGMKDVKRKNENKITYKQAIISGILISIIVAVIASIFAFIYCTFINPGYSDYMVKQTMEALQSARKTPAEISEEVAKVKKLYSTSTQVFQAVMAQLVVGTIISLITGLFIKTKSAK